MFFCDYWRFRCLAHERDDVLLSTGLLGVAGPMGSDSRSSSLSRAQAAALQAASPATLDRVVTPRSHLPPADCITLMASPWHASREQAIEHD